MTGIEDDFEYSDPPDEGEKAWEGHNRSIMGRGSYMTPPTSWRSIVIGLILLGTLLLGIFVGRLEFLFISYCIVIVIIFAVVLALEFIRN